jgi:hypothetical protein
MSLGALQLEKIGLFFMLRLRLFTAQPLCRRPLVNKLSVAESGKFQDLPRFVGSHRKIPRIPGPASHFVAAAA